MIFDKIENYTLYAGINTRIAQAFEFILNSNFAEMPKGKYEIDGDNIFAMVNEYDTKEESKCKLESHFEYIDIQYVVSGVELIGVVPMANQKKTKENLDKDCAFYEGKANLFKVEEGMFAVFFPEDLHQPGVQFNQPSKVKKVVIKVRV